MKRIVSLIVLVVFVASCSNDENEELLYNEIQKMEKMNSRDPQMFAKDEVNSDTKEDTIVPPPPPFDPITVCDGCPIDPPKGGTKP
ncbi:lipoprotein [Flavobacterium terrae]|uniref:Type IV secretion system putative lipoprotein virB7 n=1 Tax=Flavobacterium terrae TaxID=415425 RepID=A0A1M6B2F0_9FLAO|nr:lipoprotein [Flavobacterium terrae]SHI42895.1 hypothetical protein SAMN05444363_0521 [Flavobacterium terrae]